MYRVRYGFWAGLLVLLSATWGCTPARPPVAPPPPPPSPPAPEQPPWLGEPARISMRDFVNSTGVGVLGNRKAKANPIGKGMREQLANALLQTSNFVVQAESAGDGAAKGRGKKQSVKEVGEEEDVEFQVFGVVTAYTPSQASLAAGVEADLVLNPSSQGPGAGAFKALEKRAKDSSNADQDYVAMEIRLVEPKIKQKIAEQPFACRPGDFGETDGRFDKPLLGAFQPQTPMQKATRVCMIKAANWIGDQVLEWRKNPTLAAPPEFDPQVKRFQEGLNTLKYDCGKEDGKRGAKTQACIAAALRDWGIEETALETELQKRIERTAKRPSGQPPSPQKPGRRQRKGEKAVPAKAAVPLEEKEIWDE